MAGADKRFGSRGIEGSGPGFYPRQLCAYVVLINDSMSCDSQARTREREREREIEMCLPLLVIALATAFCFESHMSGLT